MKLPLLSRLFKTGEKPQRVQVAHKTLLNEVVIDNFVELLEIMPDPDRVLEKIGMHRADLQTLMYDDEISAGMEVREEALNSKPFKWEGDRTLVTFLEDIFAKHVPHITTNAFQALPYGYSVQEAIYADTGEYYIPAYYSLKPLEYFEPTRDNRLRLDQFHATELNLVAGAGQKQDGIYTYLDTVFKFFLTRRKPSYRNPYGEALLSRLYWVWFYRVQGLAFWAQYMERSSIPFIIGKGSNPDELAIQLAQAVQDAIITHNPNTEVSIENTSKGGVDHTRFEDALNKRIQKIILGQTGVTEVRPGSGLSATKVMQEVLDVKTLSDSRMTAPTVQAASDALIRINQYYGKLPEGNCPRFSYITSDNLQPERAERDLTLSQAGVELTEEYYLERYDFQPGHIKAIHPPVGVSAPSSQESDEDLGDVGVQGDGTEVEVD